MQAYSAVGGDFVLFAAESGRTVIDENLANAAMMMQEFSHIYEGTAFGGKTGAGIAEFDCAGYDHAVRFKADAAAAIARVTFEIIRHGQGADLLVELRDGFNPDGSTAWVRCSDIMVLPKEFIPTSKGYFSIPIDISDLVSGAYYWLIIKKPGMPTTISTCMGKPSRTLYTPLTKERETAEPGQRRMPSTSVYITGKRATFCMASMATMLSPGLYGTAI
jgi:hypothetical protein